MRISRIQPKPCRFRAQSPEPPGRFSLRLDVYSPPQVLQIDGRLCHLVLAFLMAGDVANSRAPSLPWSGPRRTEAPSRENGFNATLLDVARAALTKTLRPSPKERQSHRKPESVQTPRLSSSPQSSFCESPSVFHTARSPRSRMTAICADRTAAHGRVEVGCGSVS